MIDIETKLKLFSILKTPTPGQVYEPHQKQLEFHRAATEYRNVYWLAGRQTGKTLAAALEIVACLLVPHDDGMPHSISIVSDKLKFAETIFDRVLYVVNQTPDLKKRVKRLNRSTAKLQLEMNDGTLVKVRSSHNPNNLAGDTDSLLVTDESGFISDRAISIVRPTLAVRQGRHIAIGTADVASEWFRTNWEAYRDEGLKWLEGRKPKADSVSLHAKSTDSPYFSQQELERIAETETSRNVKVLYMATFESGDGRVVDNETLESVTILPAPEVDYRGRPIFPEPEELTGRRFVAGVDIGRYVDFTVTVVLEVTDPAEARLVHIDRFQNLPPEKTSARVAHTLNAFNATGWIDSTGVGDVYFDLIKARYRNVKPFHFNSMSKPQLVEHMTLMLEQGSVLLYPDKQLELEFDNYKAVKNMSGYTSYRAERGHDDVVSAFALACQGISGGYRNPVPRIRIIHGFNSPPID